MASPYASKTPLSFNLSSSKIDFLAVETLFTLFARLLPSINSGHSGRAKRSKFIQEVFLQSPFTCGRELVQVLEEVSKSAWEDTVTILMDILANNNIALYVYHNLIVPSVVHADLITGQSTTF